MKKLGQSSAFLERSLKNGWQNLKRSKFLSVVTILIIALILFVFNLILALGFASDSVIENVGEKLDLSVETQDVENYTIQTFIQTLKKHPQVKEVVYISKEEAQAKFGAKYPNIIAFLEHNHLENPLPNVIRIVSKDIEANAELISFLQSPQFGQIIKQDSLLENQEQEKRNEKILNLSRAIHRLSFWLVLIFALVGIVIIFNTININIHSRQREIQIMKLVGAKYSFIRSGFIVEGLILASLALFISMGFAKLILGYLTRNLAAVVSNETLMAGLNRILLHFEDHFWLTLSWQLGLAILAGIFSSYLAIELYLRKEESFG